MVKTIKQYMAELIRYSECGEVSQRYWATANLIRRMLEDGIGLKHWAERNGLEFEFNYNELKQMLMSIIGNKTTYNEIIFE